MTRYSVWLPQSAVKTHELTLWLRSFPSQNLIQIHKSNMGKFKGFLGCTYLEFPLFHRTVSVPLVPLLCCASVDRQYNLSPFSPSGYPKMQRAEKELAPGPNGAEMQPTQRISNGQMKAECNWRWPSAQIPLSPRLRQSKVSRNKLQREIINKWITLNNKWYRANPCNTFSKLTITKSFLNRLPNPLNQSNQRTCTS
jgi:hypothetical protein